MERKNLKFALDLDKEIHHLSEELKRLEKASSAIIHNTCYFELRIHYHDPKTSGNTMEISQDFLYIAINKQIEKTKALIQIKSKQFSAL